MPILQAITGSRLVRLAADAAFARAANWRTAQLDALNAGKFQEAMLLRFLRKAQETRFGKDHDFRQLRTVAEYQARVPIRDYDQFWNQYWKDAYPNLDNITWPGKFPYYALSSGTTTGATKYIPVSREMVKSNQKAAFTTMALFRNAYPKHRTFTGNCQRAAVARECEIRAEVATSGRVHGLHISILRPRCAGATKHVCSAAARAGSRVSLGPIDAHRSTALRTRSYGEHVTVLVEGDTETKGVELIAVAGFDVSLLLPAGVCGCEHPDRAAANAGRGRFWRGR